MAECRCWVPEVVGNENDRHHLAAQRRFVCREVRTLNLWNVGVCPSESALHQRESGWKPASSVRVTSGGFRRSKKRRTVSGPFCLRIPSPRRVEEKRRFVDFTHPLATAFAIVQKSQPGVQKFFRNAWLGYRGEAASSEDAAKLVEQHFVYEPMPSPACVFTYCSSATSFAANSADVLEAK